ncbi:MAG: DUF5119 domain-containing protein [Muribaculaceae bacterium]|nr:DUF5119 domain-containing protein [Muribaculaceae bacterium]
MKRHCYYLLLPLLSLLMSGCRHKDLWFGDTSASSVDVVFDWTKAQDANPESMSLYLFDTEKASHPLHYVFSGRDGGSAEIPFGTYAALGLNADNTSWAVITGGDDSESFELSTLDAPTLRAYNLSPMSVPRSEASSGERVAATPHMAWSGRTDNIYLPADTGRHTITVYPEEIVCHYTVDVLDVANIGGLSGASVDAVISGMAEAYHCGHQQPSGNTVTHPFVLAADKARGSLHSEFLTFGEHPEKKVSHILTIYLYLTDGAKWSYDFDVTDQIRNASDPHHVHIVVRGLTLPDPQEGQGGGFIPTVDDWNYEHIDLDM